MPLRSTLVGLVDEVELEAEAVDAAELRGTQPPVLKMTGVDAGRE
jgi:hypothetical protein